MHYIPMQYLDGKFYDNLFAEGNELDVTKKAHRQRPVITHRQIRGTLRG